MRFYHAPEFRGLRAIARGQLAACLGLLAFACLFCSLTAPSNAGERGLTAIAVEAKPTIVLPDIKGSTHELQTYAGNVVLVHFFATWCEPCRAELGSLTELLKRRDTRLSILAVNVAEIPTRVERFLETTPVNFPVLLDSDRAVTRAWGVSALPTTFVLDRALAARLWVEGELSWDRADVLAALDRVANQ